MSIRVMILLILGTCATANADVRMPTIFGDNMILQQKTNNAIWGWADVDETVTVSASWGKKVSVKTNQDGQWKLFLETPKFGTGHRLTIAGKNKLEIKNVAIGEVWLCAGQSNMGWGLSGTFGSEKEIAKAKAPGFRIYKSSRSHWHKPLEDCVTGKWSECTPESAATTSAVSYYFGKKLHDELGIPVGIIVQAYAGTPIEGWMPYEIQKDDPRTIAHKNALDKASKRFDKAEYLAKYDKELKKYNTKIARGETMKNARRALKPPIITKPANLGHQYPAHIFNAMIHPIRPYGIRGAIWYQGERNAKNPPQAVNYKKQLSLLIKYYRSSWHKMSDGNVAADFPFFFTQLPSWTPPQKLPVEGSEAPWAISREMMRLVAKKIPNTGIAVSIDTGDELALHPRNKKPIGLRLAYLALAKVYGKKIVASGPLYKSMNIQNDKIVIKFDSVGSGLIPAKVEKLNTFAIAGKDKIWHWADAVIQGDTIVVSSLDVPNPVAVRYAWAMNPSQRNLLYNKEGLPASPFRTDDWQLVDKEYGVRDASYEKPKKPKRYEPKDWYRPEMKQ